MRFPDILWRCGIGRFAPAIRRLAFWGAVVLPAVYVPVLTLDGLGIAGSATAVFVMIGGHALALIVGHGHNRPERPEASSQGSLHRPDGVNR